MSSQEKQIKVTDKRMFTPEGDLREEYRFLSEKSTAAAEPAPAPAPAATAAQALAAGPASPAPPPTREEAVEPPPLELPGTPPDYGPPDYGPEGFGPSFYDLVSMLAEPIPLYLGDMDLPNGQVVENLEMARLHIDLLDVLRQKTAGNLAAQEAGYLEDLLYRARVRYVQKTR